MTRALLILALLAALAPPPAALPVAAELRAGALVVTWPAPPEQAFGCVFRSSTLLGCALGQGGRYQLGPGSVDAHAQTHLGETVEVRSYGLDGALLGRGVATVAGPGLWLPAVGVGAVNAPR